MQISTTPTLPTTPRNFFWRLGRAFVHIVLFGGASYSVIITLMLLAKVTVGERLSLIGLFNNLLPMLFIPSFVLILFCILLRKPRIALTSIPALLAFLLFYGDLFVPRQKAIASDNAQQISVLTYNIHAKKKGFDEMVAIIREANADVVAFQELSASAAEHLQAVFETEYPYMTMHPEGETVVGKGFMSRYPILADEYWRHDLTNGHQRLELDIKGREVVFYNVHPPPPRLRLDFDTGRRSAEIDDILERASQETNPVVIAGDFNMSDQSDDYRHVQTQYTDTHREVGWGLGLSFPDVLFVDGKIGYVFPLLTRLDYVFHDAHFRGLEIFVWSSSGGSDHRPVFARLALVQ